MDGFMSGLKTRITSDEADDMNRNRTNSSRSTMLAINFHSSSMLLQRSSSSSSSWSAVVAGSCFDTTILRWPRTVGSSGPPGAGVFASESEAASSLVVAAGLRPWRLDRLPVWQHPHFTLSWYGIKREHRRRRRGEGRARAPSPRSQVKMKKLANLHWQTQAQME